MALKTIMSRLGEDDDAVHLRALVAEALDDRPLEIAFNIGPRNDLFVDSQGNPFDETLIGSGLGQARSVTALRRHGQTVAYVVHDTALETDPELVHAAGQAVLLAVEGGRLEKELQAKSAELQASQRRIVAASDAERRRLERDLHDGAQQGLVAIQIRLALLRDRLGDEELEDQVDQINEDASRALDQLRHLARGIYPASLRDQGLRAGVRALAQVATLPVAVVDDGIGRCDPAIESTIFFCVSEAIQNAAKHAGPDAHVTVTLARPEHTIAFEVRDDGVGFDTTEQSSGVGLENLRDRMSALGGQLELSSERGQGTSIRGVIPELNPGSIIA